MLPDSVPGEILPPADKTRAFEMIPKSEVRNFGPKITGIFRPVAAGTYVTYSRANR